MSVFPHPSPPPEGEGVRFLMEDFGGLQALQFGRQLLHGHLGGAKLAGGEVQPGQPRFVAALAQRQQQAVALLFQQRGVGDRAGRDDAHHLALDRTLAGGRVADLLADRHRLAKLHQPRKILLGGVIRHTRHLDRLAVGRAALRQRNVEQLGGTHRIVEEQLVEIPHAVEHQHVGMLRLDAQVLLHHWRVA